MGEESIRRPPESKKAPITCENASRAIGSLPTLKVIQPPSPTAGSSSPVEGIGLLRTRACWEDASCRWNSAEALVAAKPRSSPRRLSGDICTIERDSRGAPAHDQAQRSVAPAAIQTTAALQDFDQALVRSGSVAPESAEATRPFMPAVTAISTVRSMRLCLYPCANCCHWPASFDQKRRLK